MTSPNHAGNWRKSTRSNSGNECVEVAVTTGSTPGTASPADPAQQ